MLLLRTASVLLLCLLCLLHFCAIVLANNVTAPSKRALSVFSVVKFPNSVCSSSTSGRNGTCYTSSECTAHSGTSSGSCASSFGVCCIFEKSCDGGTVSQNTTYFTSSSRALGESCKLTICKTSADVCQLRLDFETFVMNDPVTATTITIGDSPAAPGTANSLGDCNTDQFSVTAPGGKSPPVICGTNTGQHMYVHASEQCNVLNANFGSSSSATSSAFTIKITQVLCSSKVKAPQGCLQYFTGTTGTITTYNYNSGAGVLLTNQDYSICVRSERTYCAVCYWSTAFKMSLPDGTNGNNGVDANCGFPGTFPVTMANGGGFDHIFIADGQCDSPVGGTVTTPMLSNDRYCGTELRCMEAAATGAANAAGQTVCTMNKPFKISVHTDGLEYFFPTAAAEGLLAENRGFSISYYQKTSCLTRPSS